MLLMVGLGNPGEQYAKNRHNIGFMALDAIAERYGASPWRQKFQGLISDCMIPNPKGGRVKVYLLKPQTYMNESGRSIQAAAAFYKIPAENLVVFYDELDLSFGKIKARVGGGAAGHNGIRSTIAHMGAEFVRVRMGIGHPGDKSLVTGHVLGDFAKAEEEKLTDMLAATSRHAGWLTANNLPRFMGDIAADLQRKPETSKKVNTNDSGTARTAQRPDIKAEKKEGPMAAMLRALKGEK